MACICRNCADTHGKTVKLHKCVNVFLFSLGKIQNLLPPGSVDSLTRLVLINALYFKGNWATKFEAEATRQRPFKINMVREYSALYPTLQVEKTEKDGGDKFLSISKSMWYGSYLKHSVFSSAQRLHTHTSTWATSKNVSSCLKQASVLWSRENKEANEIVWVGSLHLILNHTTHQSGIQLAIMPATWESLVSPPGCQVPFQKTRSPLQILCANTWSHKDVSDTLGSLYSQYKKHPLCYFNSILYCSARVQMANV